MKQTYDAEMILFLGERCNLQCAYCFSPEKNSKLIRIDTKRLLTSLRKTGKTFQIHFTGGEPFLAPGFVEACEAITKKHYITIATNLTMPTIKGFSEKINPKRVGCVVAALHIDELEKKNLVNRYLENHALLKKKGFNIFTVVVAHPQLKKKAKALKERFKKQGVKINYKIFVGHYKGKKYPESYTKEERQTFNISKEAITITKQKGKLCNAGYNIVQAYDDGRITPCHAINKNLGHLYKGFSFLEGPVVCPVPFCACPFKTHTPRLYKESLKHKPVQLHKKKIKKGKKQKRVRKKRFDKFLGITGKKIKRISPHSYRFMKKIELFLRRKQSL